MALLIIIFILIFAKKDKNLHLSSFGVFIIPFAYFDFNKLPFYCYIFVLIFLFTIYNRKTTFTNQHNIFRFIIISLIFLITIIVTYSFAISTKDSLRLIIILIIYSLFAYSISKTIIDVYSMKILIYYIDLAVIVCTLFVLYNNFVGLSYEASTYYNANVFTENVYRNPGPLLLSTYFGAYIVGCIPFVVIGIIKFNKIFHTLILVLIFYNIFAAVSRLPLTAAIIMILLFLNFYYRGKIFIITSTIVTFLFIFGFSLIQYVIPESFAVRVNQLSIMQDIRLTMLYGNAIDEIIKHPLGVGLMNLVYYGGTFESAWLGLILDIGILGFAILLFYFFHEVYLLIVKLIYGIMYKNIFVFAVLILMIYMIISLFFYDSITSTYNHSHFLFLFVALGLSASFDNNNEYFLENKFR